MSDPNDIRPEETVIEESFKGKRLLLSLVILLLVLAGAYAGWWFWLAAEVRSQVDAWIADQRGEGREVSYGSLDVGGFPQALNVAVRDIAVVDEKRGWRAELPGLDATMPPWDITRVVGHATGPGFVSVARGPAQGDYDVRASSNRVTYQAVDGGQVTIDLGDAEIVRRDPAERVSAQSLSLTLARGSNPVFATLSLDAKDIVLPARVGSPFGPDARRLQATLDLTGATAPAAPTAPALSAWSADGGTIEIRHLHVVHGDLTLTGSGTAALDEALQPIGAFTARIAGFAAAVDDLMQAGIVERRQGALAKIVLGAFAKTPPGGGPAEIEVPLTVQERTLSVGPIKLIRVPMVTWKD